MNKSPITIINSENMRGIIAPSSVISEAVLADLIDIAEMSSPESVTADDTRIKEADAADSWIAFEEVKERAKKAR